jgi:hypothetical protein
MKLSEALIGLQVCGNLTLTKPKPFSKKKIPMLNKTGKQSQTQLMKVEEKYRKTLEILSPFLNPS